MIRRICPFISKETKKTVKLRELLGISEEHQVWCGFDMLNTKDDAD